MPSDVPRLRYVLPKFRHGYTAMMKTLVSSLQFADSDPAQFRLHVITHGSTYGWKATCTAFGVKRRTYFLWKQKLTLTHGRLASLIPQSTAPKNRRRMVVDERLLVFIKELRESYGRVGKEKLKILVDAYAQSLNIPSYGASKLGKIIKRHHFFFDPPKKGRILTFQRKRVKYAPKPSHPGYCEMDTVHVMVGHTTLIFVTMIDVVTKVAFTKRVERATSTAITKVFHSFRSSSLIPITTIQTDNGSEFLGAFHTYCEQEHLPHVFSYPRSPRINGVIERFNRTLQEEHVERTQEWWCDQDEAEQKLTRYLAWYNGTRPHASLHYQPPLVYTQQFL